MTEGQRSEGIEQRAESREHRAEPGSELLPLPRGWANAIFEDLLDYIQPTEFIVESTEYDDKYKTPVLTAGKSFIIGYTDETKGIYDEIPVIIFDDFTTSTQFVNFPFKVKSSAMKILKLTSNFINIRFVFYYMQTLQINADTHKRYWISEYSRLPIPLPPLPEQQRIVARIEELFSSLDKGIENLKTAQQQLKVYRQAVLKWAFEGRLTNDNVVDGELPKGWRLVRLNAICNKIQDGSHFSPKIQYDEPGENRFPYITAKNIRNNYMDFSKLTYVDRNFHESIYERCNPEYGDVLLTKDGVNTGEVTLNPLKEAFSLLSSVCIFKTKRTELDSGFLKYFIQSPLGSKAVLGSMTGTAIKRIILRKIKDAEIIQPPLSEQQLIVAEIESRLSVCDKIEESIEQSLKQSESLRQSILKKAFEGKLVPQDPKDEPASELLARIRAEHALRDACPGNSRKAQRSRQASLVAKNAIVAPIKKHKRNSV
jgi:type I restriction enzyme S subunit